MRCFSESSSDHLNTIECVISKMCFRENLGYFIVDKKPTTDRNVNTGNCCSSAVSACHTAVCRCFFVQEYAIPLYYKNMSYFRRFYRLKIRPLCPLVQPLWALLAAVWMARRWHGVTMRLLPHKLTCVFCFVAEALAAGRCSGWQASQTDLNPASQHLDDGGSRWLEKGWGTEQMCSPSPWHTLLPSVSCWFIDSGGSNSICGTVSNSHRWICSA